MRRRVERAPIVRVDERIGADSVALYDHISGSDASPGDEFRTENAIGTENIAAAAPAAQAHASGADLASCDLAACVMDIDIQGR